MVRINRIQQKARIILNSDDASKTLVTEYLPPIVEAPILFDASVGTIVDLTNDEIHINDHQFKNGERVTYSIGSGATAISGLTANIQYDVLFVNENVISLAAVGTTAKLNLPGPGQGSGDQFFTMTQNFQTSAITTSTGNIRINNHTFETGMRVTYSVTGGAALNKLNNNQEYFVIKNAANTFRLAETIEKALVNDYIALEQAADVAGVTHSLRKIASFNVVGSTVVDTIRERLNIPAHGFKTGDKVQYKANGGTVINTLINNDYYYVIYEDDDSIRLAKSSTDALQVPPIAVNITSLGTGNHSLTKIIDQPIYICTNYKFRLENLPIHLSDKCKLAVADFVWAENTSTYPCKGVGGVYCKSMSPVDTYSTQGYYKGNLLLPAYFGENITYRNTDIEQHGIPMPDGNQFLQNGLDIFIDSKKVNNANQDIQGNIDDDTFSLTLIVYEIEDYEYVSLDMDEKVRNRPNVRMS